MTDFADLFHYTSEHSCPACNQETEHQDGMFYSIPAENKYLIINFHNVHLNNNFKDLLVNQDTFTTNQIILPSLNNAPQSYRIKCAIIRDGESSLAGHYIAWRENFNNSNWMRISDSYARQYTNLIKNLKNVHLLFLERNQN